MMYNPLEEPNPRLSVIFRNTLILQGDFLTPTYPTPLKGPRELSGIALSYGLHDRGFESRQRLGTSLHHCVQTGTGATQPPIQWVPGTSLSGSKPAGACEADHLPPPTAKVNNAWFYISTPQYAFTV
jgi:hypothetical protein